MQIEIPKKKQTKQNKMDGKEDETSGIVAFGHVVMVGMWSIR